MPIQPEFVDELEQVTLESKPEVGVQAKIWFLAEFYIPKQIDV